MKSRDFFFPSFFLQTDRRYQQSQDRLDAELNSYKTNLIKESIRMGYNEMGDLNYRRCGVIHWGEIDRLIFA